MEEVGSPDQVENRSPQTHKDLKSDKDVKIQRLKTNVGLFLFEVALLCNKISASFLVHHWD